MAVPAAQETPEAIALPAPQEAEEPVAVPAAQAEGTPIRYVYMSGDQKTIRIIGEIYRMTVADLLHNIKSQDGIEHSYCTLLVGENAYDEDDTSLLTTVLADVRNMGTEKLTVVKIPNYEKARKLVGEANYLSIEVWQQLLPAEELEAIVLPPLSDAMLAENQAATRVRPAAHLVPRLRQKHRRDGNVVSRKRHKRIKQQLKQHR